MDINFEINNLDHLKTDALTAKLWDLIKLGDLISIKNMEEKNEIDQKIYGKYNYSALKESIFSNKVEMFKYMLSKVNGFDDYLGVMRFCSKYGCIEIFKYIYVTQKIDIKQIRLYGNYILYWACINSNHSIISYLFNVIGLTKIDLHGNGGRIINKLIKQFNYRTLYYLDTHFSNIMQNVKSNNKPVEFGKDKIVNTFKVLIIRYDFDIKLLLSGSAFGGLLVGRSINTLAAIKYITKISPNINEDTKYLLDCNIQMAKYLYEHSKITLKVLQECIIDEQTLEWYAKITKHRLQQD